MDTSWEATLKLWEQIQAERKHRENVVILNQCYRERQLEEKFWEYTAALFRLREYSWKLEKTVAELKAEQRWSGNDYY